MRAREVKDRLFGQLSRLGKAISSPQRLELIELLAQGERTVEALARAVSLPVANTSHHLRALKAAHLVESRREGTFVHYRLADPDVFALTRLVRTLAERHLSEVEALARAHFDGRDGLEPVGRAELVARMRAAEVTVIDVRPEAEFRAGHVEGAISVPLAELRRRLSELPRGKEIVAYCRGPYCVLAVEAVRLLRARGRKARRLVEGFPEWRAAGLPVARGADEESR